MTDSLAGRTERIESAEVTLASGGAIDALDAADPGVVRAWGGLVGSALPSARP
jgi:hypothetical protein